MNILVTGANGQLGNEMRIIAGESEDKYIFTDISQVGGLETACLDITDRDAVRRMVREHAVDVIVNCAAWTNVDGAETNETLAEKLNAEAPENLAKAMKEAGGLLVHISTDYVFGGDPYNTPCKEDQKGTPTGVYGRTKLHGEEKIIATGCDHVIIRTAWLYSEFGKNFVKTMLNLTATKPELKVVFDQVGTPTYAWDLATAIGTVLADYSAYCKKQNNSKRNDRTGHDRKQNDSEHDCFHEYGGVSCGAAGYENTGIYHYSNEGVCSWYDFAKAIAEIAGHTACDIQPYHSNEFPSPVRRPAYSVLDKTKFKDTFKIRIPYWTDSLKVCIENLMANNQG